MSLSPVASILKKIADCLHSVTHAFEKTPKVVYDVFAVTDRGKVRPNNEDSLYVSDEVPVYAVCDGMGGTSAGDVASAMMAQALEAKMKEVAQECNKHEGGVIQSARYVNAQIRGYIVEHDLKAMGTTLVCLLFNKRQPSKGVVYHAGDSRAYRMRGKVMEQLTNDHSLARKYKIDESALSTRQRNALTNAIGIGKSCFLERNEIDVQAGDMFILCSDGFYKYTPEADFLRVCIEDEGKPVEKLCQRLMQMALDGGGRDNITIVIVKVVTLENVKRPHGKLKRAECLSIGWRD